MKKNINKKIIVLIILIGLTFIISVLSINSGKMSVSPADVWQVILGNGTAQQKLIVFEFRLPRIILAIFVGIGMGISGVVMQSLLKMTWLVLGR